MQCRCQIVTLGYNLGHRLKLFEVIFVYPALLMLDRLALDLLRAQ